MPACPRPKRPAPAGTILRASGKDGPQIVATNGKRWSDAAERRFLDELGASCNVTAAAAASGFSKYTAYKRRRTDPAFAAAWQATLEQAYLRIEMLLVQRAIEVLEGHIADPDAPFPDMTVKDAIAILQLHRASVKGGGARAPGWRARPRSLDEMRASILTKFEAIEAQRLSGEQPNVEIRKAGAARARKA